MYKIGALTIKLVYIVHHFQGASQQENQQEQARQQAENQENALNSMLSQILDQSALVRLSNLAAAKPDKAKMVESTIINMARYVSLPTGFKYDNKLDFSDHLKMICSKAHGVTYRIFKGPSTTNKEVLLKAYKTFVRPNVERDA
ncbi:unnamed protein product [Heligmosomoides polygyrus]|uniref:Uncharacterized protein n=1 Tax=Heligmosomoides polygyrus TaxID=6339 RepID=A0A3P7YK17_HELPZ|nr:unnamed protein product [Heligmosomoides polygyrus]